MERNRLIGLDAVLAEAPATKGAFFHHFPSKNDLGGALLERYAAADERMLEDFMAVAESDSDDPAEQLEAFVRHFEQAAGELAPTQPGCLFVSFIYESQLAGDGEDDLIATSIRHWRSRLLEKLEAAARAHPPAIAVDLRSLADQVFTTFEGGFILARAMHEPGTPARTARPLAPLPGAPLPALTQGRATGNRRPSARGAAGRTKSACGSIQRRAEESFPTRCLAVPWTL